MVGEQDPFWYKDVVIYQTHVRAFHDSNADGIGDFEGLTEKLPYLHDLGITAIWLLPFYPSPLRDDGYDIADYTAVNPAYGDLEDVKRFIRKAHALGIKVITELVINHTSDQHPWFQKSRRAPRGSKWRNFYVWSDDPTEYSDTRIIFKDFETSNWTWDPVAKQYYWHRFYHHQPDLNFENPEVHRAVEQALDFWMKLGVDGLRLDAIPYLYEREGTNCENLPETHEYLKTLRAHVDSKFENRMLLAEANQWPEDTKPYFGDGDECHMAFHFPVMPRLYMAVAMEDRFPLVDIMHQTPPIPENCQWAVFLRNHDELTLEMVTDEDRDFMWRMYAKNPRARINLGIRRRLAPLLGNHRRRIELLNGLLFSLPGTPIIYYGDEIGMGDNIYLGDRNGVRTPMQWSNDRNAGFSRANPQQLYFPVIIDPEYHYESVNVEAQRENPNSLWWWMKRMIALRKQYQAFGRGSIEFLNPDNPKVLAFLRAYEDDVILVIANLSQHVQWSELDLSRFSGRVPIEMVGQTEFPKIDGQNFRVTLGPHELFWISLEKDEEIAETFEPPVFEVGTLEALLTGRARRAFQKTLLGWLQERRWFGGKSRKAREVEIRDWIPIGKHGVIAIARIDYIDGSPEFYQLPLIVRREGTVDSRAMPIARLGADRVVIDGLWDPDFCRALLGPVVGRKKFKGEDGLIEGSLVSPESKAPLKAVFRNVSIMGGEQSNTSIVFDEKVILKMFRRLEPGTSTDLETQRFLASETDFTHMAPPLGWLDYVQENQEPSTLGMVQKFAPNGGDAWALSQRSLEGFYERVRSGETRVNRTIRPETSGLVAAARKPRREGAENLLGEFTMVAELLGTRTAEMHLALASGGEGSPFAQEPFSSHHQQSVYQELRRQVISVTELMKKRGDSLPQSIRGSARKIASSRPVLERVAKAVADGPIRTRRIRTHGDFHLGQVLYSGNDFVIIDFEGEPSRALSARKLRRSPLRDVAGMLRSLHYAPFAALRNLWGETGGPESDEAEKLEEAAEAWAWWAQVRFLRSYLERMKDSNLIPSTDEQIQVLLDAFMMEKALYEVVYELNNRPDWIEVPVKGLEGLIRRTSAEGLSPAGSG
ncbi:MAG: maltose alpha-D-glucosyltransferase [Acidobacteria bacterium]|nr:maltose alpha-D-glucosyltransferase [Acidobacteriota bacterium]